MHVSSFVWTINVSLKFHMKQSKLWPWTQTLHANNAQKRNEKCITLTSTPYIRIGVVKTISILIQIHFPLLLLCFDNCTTAVNRKHKKQQQKRANISFNYRNKNRSHWTLLPNVWINQIKTNFFLNSQSITTLLLLIIIQFLDQLENRKPTNTQIILVSTVHSIAVYSLQHTQTECRCDMRSILPQWKSFYWTIEYFHCWIAYNSLTQCMYGLYEYAMKLWNQYRFSA